MKLYDNEVYNYVDQVKLNNPLMGTETPFIRILLGKIILMLN